MFQTADIPLCLADQRLIAALQANGRVSAKRAGQVLGLPSHTVQRRWAALLASGTIRIVARPPREPLNGAMLLRIRVVPSQLDAITAALAARNDVPLIDVSASGDTLSVVVLATLGPRNRLVFRDLPAASAVTSVDAQTVIHVYSDATDWRLDVLTPDERRQLGAHPLPETASRDLDERDALLIDILTEDARASASEISRRTAEPESTVRRRMSTLFGQGHLITHVVVDPKRLGLGIDANLAMQVLPSRLDHTGTTLATHPAVHGALATTGPTNLMVAVWLRDLDHLYEFITGDLAVLEVGHVETMIIGDAVKRIGVDPYFARRRRATGAVNGQAAANPGRT
jgi:DNA-binding Lrp family transcriptional regulator